MKKYKLKKDLPTFRAGDEFRLEDSGLWKDVGEMKPIMAYSRSILEKFPNILTDWFEEISEERTEKKYKVLKDCINPINVSTVKEGDIIVRDDQCLAKDVIILARMQMEGFIKETPEQPKTVWDLKEGDTFYVIEYGEVAEGEWNYGDYTLSRDAGDLFLIEEDAEKELARRKAKQILIRDTKGFKPNWESDEYDKFEVVYEYSSASFDGYGLSVNERNHCCAHAGPWFCTRADARASIKAHEQEWKTYLGVEE